VAQSPIPLISPSSPAFIVSSSPPSSSLLPSSPPSMADIAGLFETDCVFSCFPQVAIAGDTAVVARRHMDITFFSTTQPRFEITTKIDLDYVPTSIAIDNNTVVIGSYNEGAVFIYERDQNGIWSQAMLIRPIEQCRGIRFGCDEAASFGDVVALDGNVMIVGAPGFGTDQQGSAYVYRQNGTTWIREAKLARSDGLNGYDFAKSVSVKGISIVVGGPGRQDLQTRPDLQMEPNYEGAVFVYTFDSLSVTWSPAGGVRMDYACDTMQQHVRIMDDMNLLVSCQDDRGLSTIYYYEKPRRGGEYVLKQNITVGYRVQSLAVDGNTMIVREFQLDISPGIYFFVRKNTTWEQVATIHNSIFDARFQETVALSGNIALIASDTNAYQMTLF